MAPSRLQVLAAVDFVESQFPDCQASKSPRPWRDSSPVHSHPPQHGPPPGVPADKYHSGLPNSPPPGLVRVLPATPAPIHVITNETASLFSDFAPYLDRGIDENGNPVRVQLTCGICNESKLQVSDCVTADDFSHPPTLEDVSVEDVSVLPCGHFFGNECLQNWLMTAESPTCPLCRFELVYDCGHHMEPLDYNPFIFRRGQIPMTFPEGGLVPSKCQSCFEGQIDRATDVLRNLLFPPNVVPGDLQDHDSQEILNNTSSHFKRRVCDLMVMNEHYIRW